MNAILYFIRFLNEKTSSLIKIFSGCFDFDLSGLRLHPKNLIWIMPA